MAGKGYSGVQRNNAGDAKNARAFCEGMQHRAQGTAANFPLADNPHEASNEAHTSWDLGWAVTDDAAGGTIDPDDAPNCAVPGHTISA